MTKPYTLSLHIFRRDLRLLDNTSLLSALKSSESVIPCFIFDKRQVDDNAYKSETALRFMLESLIELNEELKKKNSKVYLFYGIAEEVIENLLSSVAIQAVFINRDYTPFSLQRDKKIAEVCRKNNVDLHVSADCLLHEPEEVLKSNGQPYTIFTHFFKKASSLYVASPHKNHFENYYQYAIGFEDLTILDKLLKNNLPHSTIKGGRSEAIKLIKQIKNLANYAEIRNFPALTGTTHLSAHNKFGTVSIREVYHEIVEQFGKHHTLINELYWRDFFTHIGFHYPHVFAHAFHKKYDNINWTNSTRQYFAWCNGQTGFPIVDAGMRELNETGYMHNRVRMIVASFLTKDLHIDWHLGEKYFAQKLVDYDPAVNNGNWQWAASTGCDAQPYFRIFNPWLQQQKFDPDCIYMKKWLPELRALPSRTLHELYKMQITIPEYPSPIVNHAIQSQKAKVFYKKV